MNGLTPWRPAPTPADGLTPWRPAPTPADGLISLIALIRSPRVSGHVDSDSVTGCAEVVRLDPCSARGELLMALVDADEVDLDTCRRVLTRHGWPDVLWLGDAVVSAWQFVLEQRRRLLVAELGCAQSIGTHRHVLRELVALEELSA